MAKCIICSGSFGFLELANGACKSCRKKNEQISESNRESDQDLQKQQFDIQKILLTTENDPDIDIIERLEIITAECVFGMNIFRDFFAGVRDVFGGRSNATQKVLKDARRTVLYELKKEAFSIGANAVVAVDLDYSEFSGGGKNGMLFVVASGTAVKTKAK